MLKLRKAPITSATTGLGLLVPELHREILIALSRHRPMSLQELASWLLLKSRTAAEEHLEALIAANAVVREDRDGEAVYRLTRAGRGLVRVAEIATAWLRANPGRSLEESSPIAWRAFRALADHWRSALIEWIIRTSPTEADLGTFGQLSRRRLKKELGVLRSAGLIELRRGRDGAERYRLTDWGRRGIGVLAAAAAWEQEFLTGAEPISVIDAVTAILATMPLVRLPEAMSGLCVFTASAEPGQEASPRAGMVWARFRHGRAVACGEGAPKGEADAWASGPFSAWLAAAIEHEVTTLQCGGEEQLARAVIDQIHIQLFRHGRAT